MRRLFIAVLASLAFISCSSNNPNLPSTGEIAIIASTIPDGVLAATSEAAFSKMNDISRAKDEFGMEQMFNAGQVVILPNYCTGRVLDISFGKYQVRILDGIHKDKAVYVSSSFVSKSK